MTAINVTKSFSKLSDIVHYHRKQSGLSREQLAEISGVGKTVIYDVEHGKESIKFNTLIKILNSLNISILLDSPLLNHYAQKDHEKS